MTLEIKFLAVTLLYAVVMAGIWNFSTSGHQIAAFFIAGGIFAIGMGAPLALAGARAFINGGCSTPLFYSVIGAAVVFATTFTFTVTGWTQGQWEPLPLPPEPLVDITTGYIPDQESQTHQRLYGRGDSRTYYLYECRDGCRWQSLATRLATTRANPFCGGDTSKVEAPPPKGAVQSEAIVLFCGPDGFIQTTYQLVRDGSLWQWEKANVPDGGAWFLVSLVVGVGIGAMFGLYVSDYYARIALRHKRLRYERGVSVHDS